MSMRKRVNSASSTIWRDIRGIESDIQSRETHLNAAVDWIRASQDATDGGGSSANYNLVLGWDDPYPETTGYLVPTLYDVADQYGEPELSDRAERMARWLLSVQLESGGFPAGTYSGDEQDPSVFNTGQILRGIVRASQETGEKGFQESAVAAVEWLDEVQQPGGYWDEYDYRRTSHSYASRISWSVLEAATKFNIDIGYEVAAANLSWVLEQCSENGWYERCSFDGSGPAYLHTIAYTIRGLLESANFLDGELAERGYRAAKIGADELLSNQQQNGIPYGKYDSHWTAVSDYRCLTGNAQIGIVWARLYEQTGDDQYRTALNQTVRYLKSAQTMHGPETIYGGLRGSDPVWGRYMYLRYPNWAAKFLIDILLAQARITNIPND